MKKHQNRIIPVLLLLALLLTGCGKKAEPVQTPEPTPTPTATPEPTPDTAARLAAALDEVRALMADKDYYAAFQKIVALEDEYRAEPERIAECEAVFDELDALLKELEPASGTELNRNFPVQGGCVLEISAFSGPVLVTVTDEFAVLDQKPDPGTVTFYVRQGEEGAVNLPAGTYRITYQVGYRWFGEETGFGEYCTEGGLDPLEFDHYTSGQWSSNAKFKITL